MNPPKNASSSKTQAAQILNFVKSGFKASDILSWFPTQYNTIVKMMKFRPPRTSKTSVLHIWGPTGVGKTTLVHRVLESYRLLNVAEYYSKCGGLSKYWDGYDNQEICWIDDPVCMDAANDRESIQQLKNIFSTGNCQVEVKYGNLIFDSSIVIITSNSSPNQIALSTGEECSEPMFRRFTDTCGSYHLESREQLKQLERYLYHCIDVACDFENNYDLLSCNKPLIENKVFEL